MQEIQTNRRYGILAKICNLLQRLMMREFMTTAEVAGYLRLKERTIYELVRTRRIPCSRITGRWLFPKRLIDLWVSQHLEPLEGAAIAPPPPVIAGSHDPLLEWAVRESGSDLALLCSGSADGLRRIERGGAVAAGLHIIDPDGGQYNLHALATTARFSDVVLIEWAWREQGLVLAPDNPLGLDSLSDVVHTRARGATRQEGSGAQMLLLHLLKEAAIDPVALNITVGPIHTETDIAAAVLEGQADCGLAIRAVARRHRLEFVPLHRERFDLVMRRRE